MVVLYRRRLDVNLWTVKQKREQVALGRVLVGTNAVLLKRLTDSTSTLSVLPDFHKTTNRVLQASVTAEGSMCRLIT